MSLSFKNAEIDYEKDLIIETSKDETKTYKLSSIIESWNHISGLTISFKKDDELDSDKVDGENDGEED